MDLDALDADTPVMASTSAPDAPLATGEAPPPHVYSFDFSSGMGPWMSWMAPSVVQEAGGEHESFTRLNAPGQLDPNHLDGIGALRLVAHLSIPAAGSPGVLNLTNAEFEITIRATDFDANGGKLMVWLCRYVPEEGVYKNFYVPLVGTNWANTGNNLADQLVEGEWRTITVRLSDNIEDWTYAGENQTQQGDWADRYQPYDLAPTLGQTNATLHLVFVNDEPDDAPTGFLDIANITVRTHEPATPIDPGAATRDLFYGLEDQDFSGALPGDGSINLANATFSVVAGSVRNGTVELDAATGAFVFTPAANFYGPSPSTGAALFRYSVTDGVNTVERTAYIYIGGVNDQPTATTQDEAMTIAGGAAFNYTLRAGSDVDVNERLTYHLVDGSATNGTVTIDPANGRYVFTPATGFSGQATFSYVVSDGQLQSETRTVTLTVLPPGETPAMLTYNQAVDLLIAGDLQGFIRNVILLAEAGEPNAATFYGTWLHSGQHVPRDTTLAAHYLEMGRGIADANILLADMYATGEGVDKDYAEARLLLEALPNNAKALYKLAILYDYGYGGPVDDALAVEAYLLAARLGNADAMYTVGRRYLMGEGVEVSGADAYFWLGVGLKLGGGPALAVFDQQLLFNMEQAAAGLTTEERAALDAAIAGWTVGRPSPVNDAPVLETTFGVIGIGADATLQGSANARDVDGDRLTYSVVTGSVDNGVVVIDPRTGEWTFTPPAGYVGLARFSYVVSDGQVTVGPRTVEIMVGSGTAAVSDKGRVTETSTLDVDVTHGLLANDVVAVGNGVARITAVNGQAGDVGQVVTGAYGTILIRADGSYVFTAFDTTAEMAEGETARDVFDYTIVDSNGVTSSTTLTITVVGVGGRIIVGDGVQIGSAYNDHLIGGLGSDTLVGLAGDDVLEGGAGVPNEMLGGLGDDIYVVRSAGDTIVEFENEGNDTIQTDLGAYTLVNHVENLTYIGSGSFSGVGNALDNVLTGGAGDDVLWGAGGNDSLDGGAGQDTADYSRAAGGVVADLTTGVALDDGDGGRDTFNSIENLTGSAFNDRLTGSAGNNILTGGDGDDVLWGGGGDDILIGGAGQDTVDYSRAAGGVIASLTTGGAVNNGDGGRDGFSGIENLTGSAFNDELTGSGGNNVLSGGAGDDVILGLAGDDIIMGGGGVNVLDGGAGIDLLDYSQASSGVRAQLNTGTAVNNGDGGSDTIRGFENLTGSAFDDLLVGDAGNNIIRGGLGSDILIGGAGDDILYGGAGASNTLYGGLGNDYFVLEANDTVVEFENEGIDTVEVRIDRYNLGANIENLVYGGTGNFTGTGNGLDNILTGGAGNDVLRGRGGNDTLNGGDGSDTADYSQSAWGVRVRLDSRVTLDDGEGGRDELVSIENITGSSFNDLIVGDAGANILIGGLGSDVLMGGDGDDIIMGGQIDPNQVHGGLGNDYYILDAPDTVIEYEGEGIDTVEARISTYTLAANVENLIYTGPASFSGWGNELDNHITGGANNDYLRGMGGNDTIDGGAGIDTLYLRGLRGEYTITAEGEGYRIVDSVAGRDGSTFVLSMELLMYSNGSTQVLTYPVIPAAQPTDGATDKSERQVLPAIVDDAVTAKDAVDQPLVLPGLPNDGFVDYKGAIAEPLVQPDVFDDGLSGPGGGQGGGGLTGPDVDLIPTPDVSGFDDAVNLDTFHRSQIARPTDHDVWN
ncbi:Ig-like domain-containing protein [Brevundimonas sp. GCM10030266]|uniref:Ig-like domain-containing protein n=1 Tax=Brevundimonas sp. GCM10030266 TaxID=3273386 RepID=UPI00361A177A